MPNRNESSRRVCVLDKTDFDFSMLEIGGSSKAIAVRQTLRVPDAGSAVLVVRVHSATLPPGASFRVDARVVAPTLEDPATYFRGVTLATVVVTDTTASAPMLLTGAIPQLPSAVGFFVTATQGAFFAPLKFTISAELVLGDRLDEWTPLSLGSKLRLWLDERDLVVVSGAYSDWGDQSPAGNDFTQSTSTMRPGTGRTINTYPAPAFDGSDDRLEHGVLTDYISASAYHAFFVLSVDGVVGTAAPPALTNDTVLGDVNRWWNLFLRSSAGTIQAQAYHWDGAAKIAAGVGLVVGVSNLVEWSYDGTTIRCQVGGEPAATVAAGNATPGAGGNVYLGYLGPACSAYDGLVAAVIVCNAFLTDAERSSTRAYLASRYGVAS